MSVARKLKAEPQQKIFHATMLVTRAEQWWVEAESLEEAEALLGAGRGHRTAVGELVQVELARPRSRRRGCVTEYGGAARRYGDIVEAHGQRGRYAFSELFRRDQAEGTPDVASSNLRLRPTSERTRGSL